MLVSWPYWSISEIHYDPLAAIFLCSLCASYESAVIAQHSAINSQKVHKFKIRQLLSVNKYSVFHKLLTNRHIVISDAMAGRRFLLRVIHNLKGTCFDLHFNMYQPLSERCSCFIYLTWLRFRLELR